MSPQLEDDIEFSLTDVFTERGDVRRPVYVGKYLLGNQPFSGKHPVCQAVVDQRHRRAAVGVPHRSVATSDQWSFLWDKRRSLWIAAEDCPDGEQIEEADLDICWPSCL